VASGLLRAIQVEVSVSKILAAIACVIVSCVSVAANADSTADELAQIRAQLQSLALRVERLEQENSTLKDENVRLEALARGQLADVAAQLASRSGDAMGFASPGNGSPEQSAQPRSISTTSAGPERIVLKGDLRLRHQQSDDSRLATQRGEQLLRVRATLEAKINEQLVAGVGLATSENGNPRGANLRLDGQFSRKPLFLDLGYLDWQFAPGAHAIGGKMRMPFVRPGQSLFWDNDINPEGLALTYGRGSAFAAAYAFVIDENVPAGVLPSTASDTRLYGLQLGNRFELGSSELLLGVTYYDLAAARGHRPFFSGAANGNSLDLSGGLAYDFQVFGLLAEYGAQLLGKPVQLWLDVAHNRAADLDMAFASGMRLGKLAAPGSWELGLAYQLIEKDALFAQLIDSDFAGGFSDSRGWVLRAGFAPFESWAVNATYFLTEANVDVGNPYDFRRLMLDFNVKF
jgi:cell division protein FtsB